MEEIGIGTDLLYYSAVMQREVGSYGHLWGSLVKYKELSEMHGLLQRYASGCWAWK
jgi:hypothetical protein